MVPFYAEMGVPEVLILDFDRAVLMRLHPSGMYAEVEPDADGAVHFDVLPIRFTNLGGGRIRVATPTASEDV